MCKPKTPKIPAPQPVKIPTPPPVELDTEPKFARTGKKRKGYKDPRGRSALKIDLQTGLGAGSGLNV